MLGIGIGDDTVIGTYHRFEVVNRPEELTRAMIEGTRESTGTPYLREIIPSVSFFFTLWVMKLWGALVSLARSKKAWQRRAVS